MPTRWNFGSPKRGTPHLTMRDVRMKKDGRQYTATWHIEGDRLIVGSAWGSRSEPVGKVDPAKRAQALLGEIVDARS